MRRRGLRVAATLALALLAGSIFSDELRFFVAADPPVLFEMRDDIRSVEDLGRWPRTLGTFDNDGFVACRGAYPDTGWCLPPHRQGTLVYRLPDVPESRAFLARLFFFRRDPRSRHRLLVYRDGESSPRLRFDDAHFADARLDLSAALAGPGGGVVLRFEGDNRSDRPDVLLQFFEIRLFGAPLPGPPSVPRTTLAVLAIGLSLTPLLSWRSLVPLVGTLALGAALRFYALAQTLFLPLASDARGFYEHASRMAPFTETGFFSAEFSYREPVFVLAVKAGLALLGDAETHVRLVSFFASLLVILLVHHLATRLFGLTLGLVGALLVAVSLPLARESAGGLRLEVEQALVLLFLGVAFVWTRGAPWWHAALTGGLAGVLTLTRFTYVVALPPLVLAAIPARRPGRYRAAGLALLLMVSLQAPHRFNMYRNHGDPLWDARHTMELVDLRLPPGGEALSGAKQGYFVVSEVVVGTVRGAWKAVRRLELVGFYGALERATGLRLAVVDHGFQLAGGLGLLLALRTPALRWIPLAFVCLVVPVAVAVDAGYSVPVRASGIDRRHFYQVFPVFVLGALVTLEALGRAARARRRVMAKREPC